MTLRELQLFSLEILKDVHQFCVDNHIQYSVSDGTLIGAVRHKGFIPWDDDIDIIMRRPDFDRFCKIYKSNRFKLKYPELGDDSKVPYGRVCDLEKTFVKTVRPWCDEDTGICIDVFPIDGMIENKIKFKKYYKRSRFYFLCNGASRSAALPFTLKRPGSYNFKLFIKKVVFANGMTTNWLCRKVIRRAKAIEYGKTGFWGNLSSMVDGIMDYHRNETFTDVVLVNFEDTKVMAMNGYDEYLHDKYGDYMQLPPVEKRVPHLDKDNVFYWK